jgi:hypothetical protein
MNDRLPGRRIALMSRAAATFRSAALFALLLLPMIHVHARAAGLTEGDYRYLETEFGVRKDSFTLTNIAADDAARLHEVINNPDFKDRPKARELAVGDTLFGAYLRACQSWQLAHAHATCPEVTDERLTPGWRIAERNCIMCHLTGTTAAPSFFKLAKSHTVDENSLAEALRSGHPMSPINLEPQQLRDLALYINSLR